MKLKSPLLIGLCLLSLIAFGFAPTGAKADSAASLFLDQPDLTDFPQVTVQLSAWDSSGVPLADLKPEDFTLQEGQGATFHPQQITADTQAPLQVVLVIDVSGSMGGQPLADAKAAAARFLDRLSPTDRAALIAFSDGLDPDPANLNPQRELGLGRDRDALYNLVEKLEAGGGTHLYNAASKAVRLLENAPAGHRAILLLSDGRNDPASLGDPQQAISLAKQAHLPVFVAGLGSQIDEPYLRKLAGETGGLFRAAPKSSELARLFSDMAVLLKTRYTLTYTSQLPANGQTVDLKVTLKTQDTSVESSIPLGKLPVTAASTVTPAAAAAAATPAQPTATAALALPTAISPVRAEVRPPVPPWGWIAAAGLVVLVTGGVVLSRRRKHTPEVCARCGYDLTGKTGPCPQCGETRRLPRQK